MAHMRSGSCNPLLVVAHTAPLKSDLTLPRMHPHTADPRIQNSTAPPAQARERALAPHPRGWDVQSPGKEA